eukprot:13539-Heterococcus_DN1.PRE.2
MVAPYDVQFMKSSCCSDALKVDGIRSGLLHSQPRASKLRLDFEERGGSAVPAQRSHSTRSMHRVKVACQEQSVPTKATEHDVAAAAAAVDAQQQKDTSLFVRVGLGRADAVSPIDCDRSSSAAEGSLSPFISRNAAIIDHFKLVKRPYSRRSTRADGALGYSRPGFCLYSEKRAASAHAGSRSSPNGRNAARTRRDTMPEGFPSSRGSTIDSSASGAQQQQQQSPQQHSHRSERPHRREHRERPRTSFRDGSGSSRVAVASSEAAASALAAAAER